MKKALIVIISILILFASVACNNASNSTEVPSVTSSKEDNNLIDLVGQYHLTKSFKNKNFLDDGIEEVTLDQAIDGDTIHVYSSINGLMDIRFLGVDTPESTSHFEPWGTEASHFTKEKTLNAISIVIESENNLPATKTSDGRYLGFVWYLEEGSTEYRNLNFELVQESYSKGGGASTQYADALAGIFKNALIDKIRVNNPDDLDPNYVYGTGINTTLKQIVMEPSSYLTKKVTFVAVVQAKYYNDAFVKYTDEETNKDYYIMIFCWKTQYSELAIGNKVRITGYLTQYSETGAYQITDVKKYQSLFPEQDQLTVLETNITVKPIVISVHELDLNINPGIEAGYVTLNSVYIKSGYVLSKSGDLILTGECENSTVTIRIKSFLDSNGIPYSIDFYKDKTFNVTGVVVKYGGQFQIEVNEEISINSI